MSFRRRAILRMGMFEFLLKGSMSFGLNRIIDTSSRATAPQRFSHARFTRARI